MCASSRWIAIVVLVTASTPSAQAQRPVGADPRAELRVGTSLTPHVGPQVGIGMDLRAGWYARLRLAADAGAVQVQGRWIGRQQLSATARFLLDPFGERPLGLYGGAGLVIHRTVDADPTGALLLLLGVEGRAFARPLVPALELELGDGLRATLIWRARRADSR